MSNPPPTPPPVPRRLVTADVGTPLNLNLENLPIFNGNTNIKDFVNTIENTVDLAGWPEDRVASLVRLRLRGIAKQLIEADEQLRTTADWNILRKGLVDQFGTLKIPGQDQRRFTECRQQRNESCRQYLARLKVLAAKIAHFSGDATIDTVLKQKQEAETIAQFSMGLLDPIRKIVLSAGPTSIQQAVELAEKQEVIESIIGPSSRPYRQNQELVRNSRALIRCELCKRTGHERKYCRNARQNSGSVECEFCLRKGHSVNECYKKRQVCFGCGRSGHRRNECSVNQRWPQRESTYPRGQTLNPIAASCPVPAEVVRTMEN